MDIRKRTLADQLQSALLECPHVKGYELSVMEFSNAVVLAGTVNCFFHKQMAQESVRNFLKSYGDKGFALTLKNEIIVKTPKSSVDDRHFT